MNSNKGNNGYSWHLSLRVDRPVEVSYIYYTTQNKQKVVALHREGVGELVQPNTRSMMRVEVLQYILILY